MTTASSPSEHSSRYNQTVLVAFLVFIGLGLTGGLLGVAWPSMQKEYNLALDAINILSVVSTLAYSAAGFLIGRMMSRFGTGTVLAAGGAIIVLCYFGIAAANAWLLVIAFTMVFGFGSGILDAGLNLYIATYHTAQQMNWLHACFGIGITFGPLIMTFVLQKQLGWHMGYAIVGGLLLVVLAFLLITRNMWRSEGLQTAERTPVKRANFGESFRVPALWLSMATFLTYVGLEIGTGQWAYTVMTESRHIEPAAAGPWVSFFWGAFTGGRIVFGIIANKFNPDKVLRWALFFSLIGIALFWWNPVPWVGFLGLIVTGVAQAPVFPMLMSATARRVGAEHAENGISMQMGAVGLGSAILPSIIGTVGRIFGYEMMAAMLTLFGLLAFVLHEATLVARRPDEVETVQPVAADS
jgi:fucose permease